MGHILACHIALRVDRAVVAGAGGNPHERRRALFLSDRTGGALIPRLSCLNRGANAFKARHGPLSYPKVYNTWISYTSNARRLPEDGTGRSQSDWRRRRPEQLGRGAGGGSVLTARKSRYTLLTPSTQQQPTRAYVHSAGHRPRGRRRGGGTFDATGRLAFLFIGLPPLTALARRTGRSG